jgi:predicted GIY-YIG superfamily endonuclease
MDMKLYTFYKIVCDLDGRVYIGCTSKPLEKRWQDHQSSIRTKPRTPFHKEAANIGLEHFSIHKLDSGYYTRREAVIEEERYIEQYDSRRSGFNGSWARIKEENGWFGKGASNDNFTDPNKNPSKGVIQNTSKPVLIEGVEYPSISHAARALQMDRTKVSYRVKTSKGFPDWKFL